MEESDSETGNASDSSSEDARKKRHRHGGKSKATSQVSGNFLPWLMHVPLHICVASLLHRV
jgi:hypothetical protein